MTDAKLDQVLLALVKAATFTGMRAKPAGVARHFGVPLKQAQRAVRRLRARGVAC